VQTRQAENRENEGKLQVQLDLQVVNRSLTSDSEVTNIQVQR
jgi:hypothetical protein